MKNDNPYQKCVSYLKTLCEEIPERSVGSEGNRRATSYFEKALSSLGWQTEMSELDVIDWEDGGATLQVANQSYNVLVSPYSLGCSVQASLNGDRLLEIVPSAVYNFRGAKSMIEKGMANNRINTD